jgi:ubiquitin carboxyl-terminal hydrolase 8
MQLSQEKRVRVRTRRRRGKALTLKIERGATGTWGIRPHLTMTEPDALGGLINMGQTCYANSVIQCFRNCPKVSWIFNEKKFTKFFQQDPAEPRGTQQVLCLSFADIIQLLNKCRRGQSVRPADFWTKFRDAVSNTGFEHMAARIQHDSHEFYLCLLDILHEATSQQVEMKILRPDPKTEEEAHCIQALETWKREFEKKYSPFVDLFYGLVHVVIQCNGCKRKSHRWESFTALKAAVPEGQNVPTLEEMLHEELKPEIIPGYDCEKCRPNKQDATRSVRIWRLPLYLTIIIKRFTPDGRKIHKPMKPLENTTVSFESFFSEDSPEYDGKLKYDLTSIVDHHGSAGGGHYTAQCKAADGKWHMYDDESVSDLPNAMFGGSTYMLWFERKG